MSDHDSVFIKAIDTFGEQQQIIVAIEELSELQKELCKLLRGQYHIEDMSEEIADVEIMLSQVKIILVNHEEVEKEKERKVLRLQNRIEDFKGEKSPSVFPLPLDI